MAEEQGRNQPTGKMSSPSVHATRVGRQGFAVGAEILPQEYPEAGGWTPTETVRAGSEEIGQPQVAVRGAEVHVVWVQGGWIWHAVREEGTWSEPERVAVGTWPALAVDKEGRLHMVFLHDFAGNFEVYYLRWAGGYWTLPYNISRTPGISHNPTLAISPSGLIYAAWEDDTPGYPSIYHAYNPKGTWINAPVPGTRGWRPELAFDDQGTLHLVWEDAVPGGGGDDIYHSQLTPEGWSLPENISDTPDGDSSLPRVSGAPGGVVHVVWQEQVEGSMTVGYAYGRFGSWLRPIALAVGKAHREPAVSISPKGYVHVVWVAGDVLAYRSRGPTDDAEWHTPEAVVRDSGLMGQPALTSDAEGQVHLVWRQAADGAWKLHYRQREPGLKHKAFMPRVVT